ncbi:uncharacterized protein LOC122248612 [Penaeus japonicus]|uniref:uncharacterized protein LOC122248612 n=1 Tax=Penaeus japonicus TaxID=27405 RepID=UPI001C71375A|nr:uncharacterized protein LOC122248612 [Penaeus japonicus]
MFLAWLLCCATVHGSCVCHLLLPTAWLLRLNFVYVLVMAGQVFLAGNIGRQKQVGVTKPLHQFLVVGMGFHTLSLLGTSHVEEEHQTIYFLHSLHVGFVISLIIQIKCKVLMEPHSGLGRHGSASFDAGRHKGNSNGLATVDISAGFVGVTSYRPFVRGALVVTYTFVGTFLTYLMNTILRDTQKESVPKSTTTPAGLCVKWQRRGTSLSLAVCPSVSLTLKERSRRRCRHTARHKWTLS